MNKLTFSVQFGIVFKPILTKYIDESRAVKIALKYNLDTEQVRLILAEFYAVSERGFKTKPSASFVWMCKNSDKIKISKIGEENLPTWA